MLLLFCQIFAEQGDIRIFSKRCTHAFHKECVFEWLVKGHEECPCCRAEMVSKSEIKETSASLIGTERLAQAMAVFNGSGMIEAPPFQARRPRLAAHLLARTRSRGPSGHNMRGPGVDSSSSNNAHWLWAARFQDAQPGASSATGQMARVREDAPLSPQRSPHRPTSSTSPNNIHNRDWLWTNRFDSAENPSPTNQSVPISRANGPTSDNANQENQIPPGASDNASGNAAVPNTSMYHDHWTQSRPTRTSTISLSPRRASQPSGPIALSPSGSNRHAYWQQPSGPIALSPSGSTRHAHWQRASQPDHSSSVARHYATILEGTSPANSRDALESETVSSPTTRG